MKSTVFISFFVAIISIVITGFYVVVDAAASLMSTMTREEILESTRLIVIVFMILMITSLVLTMSGSILRFIIRKYRAWRDPWASEIFK